MVRENAEQVMGRLSSVRRLSSGSVRLDSLLGGGYAPGMLVELFGRSNSGKSQAAMQAVAVAAMGGQSAVYIDSEGAFRPERVKSIAAARGSREEELLDRIVYVRVRTAAAQMDAVRALAGRHETAGCRLVVVDTLTRNFTLDYPGGTNLARRQGALDVHLSEMARDAVLHCRSYLLTNRVTFGSSGDTSIGGSTLGQLVHASIQLAKQRETVTVTMTGPKPVVVESRLSERGLE